MLIIGWLRNKWRLCGPEMSSSVCVLSTGLVPAFQRYYFLIYCWPGKKGRGTEVLVVFGGP
jgi:hypothetical protein